MQIMFKTQRLLRHSPSAGKGAQVSREAVLSQVDIDISHANIDISLCFGSLYPAI
jgi:hypothetical protein